MLQDVLGRPESQEFERQRSLSLRNARGSKVLCAVEAAEAVEAEPVVSAP